MQNDFRIQVSQKIDSVPPDHGRMGDYDFIRMFSNKNSKMLLPKRKEIYPHQIAISWHRENKFHKK
ncbi:MAG: hypothetical protein M3R36_03960 [Bacteroidota bacterium]|nr:hypothetical protein [Bacteroidota bacterium]